MPAAAAAELAVNNGEVIVSVAVEEHCSQVLVWPPLLIQQPNSYAFSAMCQGHKTGKFYYNEPNQIPYSLYLFTNKEHLRQRIISE